MPFFCPGPCPGPHVTCSRRVSLGFSSCCDGLSNFPCLCDLDRLGGGAGVLQKAPLLELVWYFPCCPYGYFGRRRTKGACCHHDGSPWCRPRHLAQVCCRALCCMVLLPPLPLPSLEGIHSPGAGVMPQLLGAECLQTLFATALHRLVSFLLFIYLFNH